MKLQQRIELTQQTLAALRAVNNNGGKVPDGYVLEFMMSPSEWDTSGFPDDGQIDDESHYRLTPIPQPRRVPLTLGDVDPNSAFSFDPDSGWFCVNVNSTGIVYRALGNVVVSKSWQDLMDEKCKIYRPGGSWQPCWKEATE